MEEQINGKELKFLDRNPPNFPEKMVRRFAQEQYDLSGDFRPLKSERDQNFHIQTEKGRQYVLKLSNAVEDPGVIDFQIQALRHIARQDPTLPVPRVVPATNGDAYTLVENGRGVQHILRVLTFLPGAPLHEADITPAHWWNIGKLAGRMDLALRGFFHPYARNEHPWDITRCAALRPHTAHVSDPAARRNIDSILDHMSGDILPRLRFLRHQVIHNDLDANNTLTDPARPDSISGIIDFGDMIFGPTIVEVAIAAHDAVDNGDFMEDVQAVVAGFDSILPLEEEEIDLLYDLILARLAVTATIIAWRKEMTPDQPNYIHESEAPCWEAIDKLQSLGRERVADRLRRRCLFPPYCPVDQPSELPQDATRLLARRRQVLGAGLKHFYDQPLHIERSRGPWLYSAQGKPYLDAYNNVPVAGHCHPHVVKAIARQTAALNTNTRYLYAPIVDYAERLTSSLPGDLSVCLFANSGSEVNDIAWRMAQFITGRRGALVMEDAYHGITESIADLTPSNQKHGLPAHVRTLMSPDPYRGPYRYGQPNLAGRYAQDAARAIADLEAAGFKTAAFMIDSAFVSNGMPDVPAGYLAAVSAQVRQAGGLIIADEVQSGFGRMGTHLWGFMAHGFSPDIVTMGKPIGNGYPLGVIVTRPEILSAFSEETGLFSTFGGNPVACAAGMAVLDVIEGEGLLHNAQQTGEYLRQAIRDLMGRQPLIGDVRGWGLLAGVELVRDRATREPAAEETTRVLNLMAQRGVLVGWEGRHGNVIKIRPPLVFGREHADILVEALEGSLVALPTNNP